MMNKCKGGCGKEIPSTSKSGYAYGHKNGCPDQSAPGTTLAVRGQDELIVELEQAPVIVLELSEYQVDAIWKALPLNVKGSGILTALDCDRD